MLIPRSKAPTHRYRCLAFMHDPSYYRSQAERARRLALVPTDRGTQNTVLQMAQDYLDLVEDLESGAIEIRHPELMPQKPSSLKRRAPPSPAGLAGMLN